MKPSTTDLRVLNDEPSGSGFLQAISSLSSKTQWRMFRIVLLACDIILLNYAFIAAYEIRFRLNFALFNLEVLPSGVYYEAIRLVLISLWLTLFASQGLYNRRNLLGGIDEYALVFRGAVYGLLVLVFASFLQPSLYVARGWLILAWAFSFLFPATGRFLLRRAVYFFRARGYFLTPTLIIGANDEGLSLARQLVSWNTSGLRVVGFLDKKIKAGTPLVGNIKVLGTVDRIEGIVDEYGIEEVILARSAISTHEKLLDIFKRYGVSGDVNLRMSSGLYEILTTGLTVKEFAYIPLVCVNKVRLSQTEVLGKMILDYCVTIPLLILLSPLLAVIAIAVRIDSPGPIVHRRRVMGMHGKPFDAYKFRTMHVDGERILEKFPDLRDELARSHKLKEDPRITRVGRILRRFSLDELLQLFNVFKREMSLVGPRIISPEEMVNYNHWAMNLLTILPGITGLWQVSGRSDITYEERVRLDMHYIRNWSIWLDIQLLLRTVPAVLQGRGAY